MPVPPLSIILPNYNHAEFLPRCIEAFLGQSFGDFELIVVDDASTDDSFELLQEYARCDSRIRLYRNSENQGVVGNLNRAMSYCRGEYVHGAASDDYVLPGYFKAAMDMFRQHPHAGICLGLTRCVNEKGMSIVTVPGHWSDAREYLSPEELAPQMVTCGVPGPSIWRRDAFLQAGGYNPELRWHCDWFTLQVVAFRHGLCFMPEVFTVVRMVENSYSNNQSRAPEQQRKVLQTLLRQLQLPQYRDVVPLFTKSGIMRQFGFDLISAVLEMTGIQEDVVELMKPVVLPHAEALLQNISPSVRAGAARYLGQCGAVGLAFDDRLAAACRDKSPKVADAARAALQSIQQSVPFWKRLKHKLRRTVGRNLRRIDRYMRPLIHDRLARQERLMVAALDRQNEVRSDVLGNLIELREEVAELKKQLLAPEAAPLPEEHRKNRVQLELEALPLPVRSR